MQRENQCKNAPWSVSASLYQHQKGWQFLLLGTPVFVAGDANLAVTQVMKIDENWCPIN